MRYAFLLVFLTFCFSQEIKEQKCKDILQDSSKNKVLEESQNNSCKKNSKEEKMPKKGIDALKKFIKS